MTKKPRPELIKFIGDAYEFLIEDYKEEIKEIYRGSNFLYQREHDLTNVLMEAFYELLFLIKRFEMAQTELLAKASPNTEYLIREFNEFPSDQKFPGNVVLEFMTIDLSTYFKAFLVVSKSVLDKLVPLYSYRFGGNLVSFNKKGKRLINSIEENKKSFKKKEMVALIKKAKHEWIDAQIDLRDEYTHYSDLKEFRNFWISIDDWSEDRPKLKDLTNFNKPTIEINGQMIPALDYMLMIKAKMIGFIGEFLRLCEFTPDRPPKVSLRCIECDYVFAKTKGNYPQGGEITINQPIEVYIKDEAKGYGLIFCPVCGEKTDTDMNFWPQHLFQSKMKK